MADRINKFGQEVTLVAYDSNEVEIFQTDTLRVDFDVRHIATLTKAKISLFNLSTETVRLLTKPKSIFISIWVSLHGSTPAKVCEKLFVSNAINETKVPNTELSLYCTGRYENFLNKAVDVWVHKPTLRKMIESVLREGKFPKTPKFLYFPIELLDYVNYRPTQRQGSVMTVLKSLGDEFGFTFYTEANEITFVYGCRTANYKTTDFENDSNVYTLNSNNMRASPKIGIASLSIVSNLDTNIKPGIVLDISKLVTASVDTDFTNLTLGTSLVEQSIAGYSKYMMTEIQHKGSNWVDTWQTQAIGYPPLQGETMNTDAWWTPHSHI